MIHHRRTVQIAPGRQADAVAQMQEWVAIWKEVAGIDVRISLVTTGTLGRMCASADYPSMGAFEEAMAKVGASPAGKTLNGKQEQEMREGTYSRVPNTAHDEFWRYS